MGSSSHTWLSCTAVALSALVVAAWPARAQDEDSSRWIRVAQSYTGGSMVTGTVGARGAVFTLAGGARLELPPRRTAVQMRLSTAPARTAPCGLAGFAQVRDTLRLDGPQRSSVHFTLFLPEGTPLRARAGHSLVLAAHRRTAAAVGGAQTETIGAAQTETVGGAQTDTVDNNETITIHGGRTESEPGTGRWSGDYYVTPVVHVAGATPGLRATVRVDADVDTLHVGWLRAPARTR